VAGLTVLLLVGVAAGLLLAAILAVYDYTTPAIETPLVTIVALIFIATLVFNILAAGVRSLGSRR
jgi:predicted neutral ceramidase superfamily lipid hydrolase